MSDQNDNGVYFSRRLEMEGEVEAWFATAGNIDANIFNVITALSALGYLVDKKAVEEAHHAENTP